MTNNYVGLAEALVASSRRKYILSEPDKEGVRHGFTPGILNARAIGEYSAVCDSRVLPQGANKMRWEVV